MKVFPFFERERERTVLLLFNAAGVIVRVLEFSGFWFATSMLTCHVLCYYGHSGRNSLSFFFKRKDIYNIFVIFL